MHYTRCATITCVSLYVDIEVITYWLQLMFHYLDSSMPGSWVDNSEIIWEQEYPRGSIVEPREAYTKMASIACTTTV